MSIVNKIKNFLRKLVCSSSIQEEAKDVVEAVLNGEDVLEEVLELVDAIIDEIL